MAGKFKQRDLETESAPKPLEARHDCLGLANRCRLVIFSLIVVLNVKLAVSKNQKYVLKLTRTWYHALHIVFLLPILLRISMLFSPSTPQGTSYCTDQIFMVSLASTLTAVFVHLSSGRPILSSKPASGIDSMYDDLGNVKVAFHESSQQTLSKPQAKGRHHQEVISGQGRS